MLTAGCGDDDNANGATTVPSVSPQVSDRVTGDITVFAASSLTGSFQAIGEAFHAAHPGVSVQFNFAGSQDLRTQLEQGARADVLATADTKQMQMAYDSGVVTEEATVFAHNRLVVIVPKANEAGVATLHDLANSGLKIVLASADVPVGNYSHQFLDKASAAPDFGPGYKDAVLANVVSEESNVKQVVSRIQLDEADAGICYSSDVTPEVAGDVTTIAIPDALNQLADYPIAVTADAGSPGGGQAFIDYVLSDDGQAALEAHGFIPVN